MKPSQLQSTEYASYYGNYIDQVTDEYTLIEELEISLHRFIKFVQDISMDKFDYRYAEGKWTIKDIIQLNVFFLIEHCVLREMIRPNCRVLKKMSM